MTFKDTQLVYPEEKMVEAKINEELILPVRQYLPIKEKVAFIQSVVNGALDENTGCFSPIRVEVFFSLAICRWYAGIVFDSDDLKDIEKVYDTLETNGVINKIIQAMNDEEYDFMKSLVQETIDDIARYNSSAAGIIRMMSVDAGGLGDQVNDILEKIKNKEGIETLDVIKNVVGKD